MSPGPLDEHPFLPTPGQPLAADDPCSCWLGVRSPASLIADLITDRRGCSPELVSLIWQNGQWDRIL